MASRKKILRILHLAAKANSSPPKEHDWLSDEIQHHRDDPDYVGYCGCGRKADECPDYWRDRK